MNNITSLDDIMKHTIETFNKNLYNSIFVRDFSSIIALNCELYFHEKLIKYASIKEELKFSNTPSKYQPGWVGYIRVLIIKRPAKITYNIFQNSLLFPVSLKRLATYDILHTFPFIQKDSISEGLFYHGERVTAHKLKFNLFLEDFPLYRTHLLLEGISPKKVYKYTYTQPTKRTLYENNN